MPQSIKIPKIKGLAKAIKTNLANHDLKLNDINNDTLSVESFELLKREIKKLADAHLQNDANFNLPDKSVKILSELIVAEITKTFEKDKQLSQINRQETQDNLQNASAIEREIESLGTYLAKGKDIAKFGGNGWADESLPTIVADLVSKETQADKVVILGPLQSLELASKLTQNALFDSPLKTDALAFVRMGGNHWQLVHTQKTNNRTTTSIFNPIGDGACGYRAAAECLSRLRNKHDMQFGLTEIIPSDGIKEAIMAQSAKLYKHIDQLTAAKTTNLSASITPAGHKPNQSSSAKKPVKIQDPIVQDKRIAMKAAASELKSTGAMLSALNKSEKRHTIIASQQKMLDYYSQVKTDAALAKSLQTQENEGEIAKPLQTSTSATQLKTDEAFARQLQAEFNRETKPPITHSPRLSK